MICLDSVYVVVTALCSSRIPQRAAGWLTLGGKPEKPLLFPLLHHLTRDSILYITLQAPGSSCGQSDLRSSATTIVLLTHSQTACLGCPPLLLTAEETWAIRHSCVFLHYRAMYISYISFCRTSHLKSIFKRE